MLDGKIKYYNSEQRFGLIKRADGDRDVRFLYDALVKAGVVSTTEGQSVKFELVVDPDTKKVTAGKLEFD